MIALTGGIGSGKSTIVDMFKTHHVPIIDTDIIARQLLNGDTPAKTETIAQFGKDITLPNGEIDRGKLRQRIFTDDAAREQLQSILHPRIYQQTLDEIEHLDQNKTSQPSYCLIVIPLLCESSRTYPHHRVLVIDSTEALQLERASRRDQCDPELIKKIIASQASREQRLAIADDVISNNGDLDTLQEAVAKLHQQYSELARTD